MGRPDDAAKAVLAEYRAIRREYNGLDGKTRITRLGGKNSRLAITN